MSIHTYLRVGFLLTALAPLASTAHAEGLPVPGDFYLIARDKMGDFAGSHKIFRKQSAGLFKVAYCNNEYWVRAHSVAWAQVEVERRRTVRIEFNFGKGWRPICENPERQVTVTDLGFKEDPHLVLETSEKQLGGVNRFTAIKNAFQTQGDQSDKSSSYHQK